MEQAGATFAWLAQASPQQLFEDIQGDLYGSWPWIAALVLGIVVYLVVAFAKRKVRGGRGALDEEPFLDLNSVKRTGLLSEEEMSAVKRTLAATYVRPGDDGGQHAARTAESLVLFEERLKAGGIEAALSPAERAEHERLKRLREEAQTLDPAHRFDRYRDMPMPGGSATESATVPATAATPVAATLAGPVHDAAPPSDAAQPADPAAGAEDESFGALDPLSQRDARPEARFDAMLKAGAITRAEYDEMVAFYRKRPS